MCPLDIYEWVAERERVVGAVVGQPFVQSVVYEGVEGVAATVIGSAEVAEDGIIVPSES